MGEGANAIVKLLEKPVEIICKLSEAEVVKTFGGILDDEMKYWRWKNRLRVLRRAAEIVRTADRQQVPLPPDFLMPLLDAAADISDETLQEAWARLLAEACTNLDAQHKAYVEILRQLSPQDATVLQVWVTHGPFDLKERSERIAEASGLLPHAVKMSCENLYRLGLFTSSGYGLRRLALEFLRVCLADQDALEEYERRQGRIGARLIRTF